MATGVIGLGNIGGHIAANLVADGNDVVVHDVDLDAMSAVSGATAAPDVATVAGMADITLLSLPTPDVVSTVAAEWAGAAAPGAVLVDLSTNSPAVVRELGERLAASGHHLVEAPLTGGAIGAEKRMLVFMVGHGVEVIATGALLAMVHVGGVAGVLLLLRREASERMEIAERRVSPLGEAS